MIDEMTAAPAGDAAHTDDAVADQPAAEQPAPVAPAPVAPAPVAPVTRRFTGPDHVASISLSTGRILAVADGVLDAPEDLTADERASLHLNGFTAT